MSEEIHNASIKPFIVKIINSNFFIYLAGTASGFFLSFWLNSTTIKQQAKIERIVADYEHAKLVGFEVIELSRGRAYYYRRLLWSLENGLLHDLDETWSKYYDAVDMWNRKSLNFQVEVGEVFGSKTGTMVIGEDYGKKVSDKNSVNDYFYIAHKKFKSAKDKNWRISKVELSELNKCVDETMMYCNRLTEEVGRGIIAKRQEMELRIAN